jgi:hypothetical protein
MKDVKWVVAIATAAALGSSGAALAAGPTKADFQACNREAKAAVTAHSNPGALPSKSDRQGGGFSQGTPGTGTSQSAGVPQGQVGTAPTTTTPPAGGPTYSDRQSGGLSPQTNEAAPGMLDSKSPVMRGMDRAGRKDSEFQRAYLECMRGRGFTS